MLVTMIADEFRVSLNLVISFWRQIHSDDMEYLMNELAAMPQVGSAAFPLMTGKPFDVRPVPSVSR